MWYSDDCVCVFHCNVLHITMILIIEHLLHSPNEAMEFIPFDNVKQNQVTIISVAIYKRMYYIYYIKE